jgi:hypothetical protein
MLLSAVLITLGAPFWFNTLKGLLSLRSSLQSKETAQQAQRTGPKRKPMPPPPAGGSAEPAVG